MSPSLSLPKVLGGAAPLNGGATAPVPLVPYPTDHYQDWVICVPLYRVRHSLGSGVTRVPTALTLCLSTPSRNSLIPSLVRVCTRLRDTKDNERLTINRSTQRRLQDSATAFIYNQIIMFHIKYINIRPDFTIPGLLLRPPSDQDNLHPLSRAPPSKPSILDHSGNIPITHPVSLSDHSGPNPHQIQTQ